MSKNYQVVCRIIPCTLSDLGKAQAHQTRKHRPDHFLPECQKFNRVLHGCGDVQRDVETVLKNYEEAKGKNVAAEFILSADDEYFDSISPGWRDGIYSPAFEKWVKDSTDFLKKNYVGFAGANLHLDEQSPHIHAFVVPVATYEISTGRGSSVKKTVTRVRYNAVFGDDAQVIARARKEKNSELTKCGRLQTAYAEAMKGCGLKRGIKNSTANHMEIQEYQKRVNTKLNLPKKPRQPKRPPEAKTTLGFPNAAEKEYLEKMDQWHAAVQKWQENRDKWLDVLTVKALKTDELLVKNDGLKSLLIEKDAEIEGLKMDKKELHSRLRAIPVHEVLSDLGRFDLDAKKWRNSIDCLKDVCSFSFDESIAWLSHFVDENAAAATAADLAISHAKEVLDTKPDVPLTSSQKAKWLEIKKQLAALGADKYRVTLTPPMDSGFDHLIPMNFGNQSIKQREKSGEKEVFYTANEIAKPNNIVHLERLNRQGYNVYVTPLSEDSHFILVDDLTDKTVNDLRALEPSVAVLQSSSWGSIQAVLKVPKTAINDDQAISLFNDLNQRFGDPKIRGLVHPFRLAGFANMKKKHINEQGLRPFTKILETSKATVKNLIQYALSLAPRPSASINPKEVKAVQEAIKNPAKTVSSALDKEASDFYEYCQTRWGSGVDYSRADFMLVQRLTAKNIPKNQIARVLLDHSPDIQNRHRNTAVYVENTISSTPSL